MNAKQWTPHERDTWPWRVATLKIPVPYRTWHGHGATPGWTEETLPVGTKVKIVMVSRLGDVGISKDLSAETGYGARVLLDHLEQAE